MAAAFDIGFEVLEFARYAQVVGLRYMIVGGACLNLHGIKRTTEDTDIWIEPSRENWTKLVKVIELLGYSELEINRIAKAFTLNAFVFTLIGPIDVMNYADKRMPFNTIYERALIFKYNDININALSLGDLREMKAFARRPRDVSDVYLIDDYLLANNQPSLDKRTRLQKWWDRARLIWKVC